MFIYSIHLYRSSLNHWRLVFHYHSTYSLPPLFRVWAISELQKIVSTIKKLYDQPIATRI